MQFYFNTNEHFIYCMIMFINNIYNNNNNNNLYISLISRFNVILIQMNIQFYTLMKYTLLNF